MDEQHCTIVQKRGSPREKLWHRLHAQDGRRLENHPMSVAIAQVVNYHHGPSPWYVSQQSILNDLNKQPLISSTLISWMEVTMDILEFNAMLREANKETGESIKGINDAYNKVRAVKDQILPEISSITKEMRDSRMTVEREMKTTLESLKNVRDFFLEKSYETEMARIKEFISICKMIKSLKDNGTLDAVADLAIKLAAQ